MPDAAAGQPAPETKPEPGPREPRPVLTVLIASLDSAATLQATLEGLGAQRWDRPWEIVLADNGSTDDSPALFEAFARRRPDLAMRKLDARPRGKPHALNAGIAAARGAAIAVCDADDVPGEGWLAAMGDALDRHEVVAGRIDFDRLNRGWVRESRASHQSRELHRLAFLPELVHAGGGTMGLRRAVVDAIGGFDPGFPYIEDTEFCVRAQLAGFPIAFVPEAVMHVRARSELGPLFRQNFNWARYEMRLVRRHRDRVSFAGGWARHLAAWRRLLRTHLRQGLVPGPKTMSSAVRLRAGAGRLAGELAGALLERVPLYGPSPAPPPRGAPAAGAPR